MPEQTEERTVKQWLEELGDSSTSTEEDDKRMQDLLHEVDFPLAICTCGIAYLEGKGTVEYPPMSIQSVANMLLLPIIFNTLPHPDSAK